MSLFISYFCLYESFLNKCFSFLSYVINNVINGIDVYKNEHYHPVTSPPDERLDYIIYYGKNIEFIGNKLVISDASDHYGVIGKRAVDFRL